MLIEEDNDEVLVPLYFDSRHGAAVYIIGTYYYDGAIDTDNCCVVMVSHFNVLYSGVYYTETNDGDIDIGLQCEFFDTVAEAFECLHDGSKSDDFYDDYRANNSIAEPENINSVFQSFFNFDKDRKFKSKITADREEIGKAYDNNKSAMLS